MNDGNHGQAPPARRDFLNLAIASTAASLGVMSSYPAARFLQKGAEASAQSAEVGKLSSFERGTAQRVLLGDKPVLVLRLEDGTFRAFVALCSHLQCTIGFSSERKQIECACHGGVFSLEGRNIAGPPPRPLTTLKVTVQDDVVTVSEV